jgi:hypothetical protein
LPGVDRQEITVVQHREGLQPPDFACADLSSRCVSPILTVKTSQSSKFSAKFWPGKFAFLGFHLTGSTTSFDRSTQRMVERWRPSLSLKVIFCLAEFLVEDCGKRFEGLVAVFLRS